MADTLQYGVGRERKGTMFFRSDEMNYGRAVLNSNWDEIRQAEPKDYDICRAPVRDLLRSTYKHLGTAVDLHKTTETTYKNHFTDDIFSSAEFGKGRSFEGELRNSSESFAVLPPPNSAIDHDHYVTTHKADYKSFTASAQTKEEKAKRGEDKANDGSIQQYTCTYVVPPAGVKL